MSDLSEPDRRLFQDIKAHVRAHPADFTEAGRWLDHSYSLDTLRKRKARELRRQLQDFRTLHRKVFADRLRKARAEGAKNKALRKVKLNWWDLPLIRRMMTRVGNHKVERKFLADGLRKAREKGATNEALRGKIANAIFTTPVKWDCPTSWQRYELAVEDFLQGAHDVPKLSGDGFDMLGDAEKLDWARRLIVLAWLIADPEAGKLHPEVSAWQNEPWALWDESQLGRAAWRDLILERGYYWRSNCRVTLLDLIREAWEVVRKSTAVTPPPAAPETQQNRTPPKALPLVPAVGGLVNSDYPPRNRGGRPPLTSEEKRSRFELADEWERYKGSDRQLKDFADDRKQQKKKPWTTAEVERWLNWCSKNKHLRDDVMGSKGRLAARFIPTKK